MMSKPDIKEVLAIGEMKQQARTLYDEIDKRITALKSEYGAGRFDYDLEQFVDDNSDNPDMELSVMRVVDDMKANGRYLKFEIVDNAAKIAAGESIFKKAYVNPVAFETRGLKRCPDSLK